MVTYIIRPITVSDEPCRLFHQQTGPVILYLVLILTVMCAVNQKSFRAHRETLSYTQTHTHTRKMNKFCCLLRITLVRLACVFQCSAPAVGEVTVFQQQQINIYTHISGSSTHCTRGKLLQSFLWRKEMMPNQPRESGITQNNGVIEAHWGESLPELLWAWTSRWCPLAWRPHSRALFPPQAWM